MLPYQPLRVTLKRSSIKKLAPALTTSISTQLSRRHFHPSRATQQQQQQQQQQASTSPNPTSDHVRIVEVGPRDGLQNEKQTISLATKLELINRLAGTGLKTIETGSFVSPRWVPQMESSREICEHLRDNPPPAPSSKAASPSNKEQEGIAWNWLVPNEKGMRDLLSILNSPLSKAPSTPSQNTHEVSLFTAATESFSRANTNRSIADSISQFEPVISLAKNVNLRVRAYISVALGCPYEGPQVDPHRVAAITASLLEMGADEVSIGDTTGMGTVRSTRKLLQTLHDAGIQSRDLALHFHDTFGMALCNVIVGLEYGVRTFDASVAGLGGCPYSKGATGNVSTEDLVYAVESLGMRTGVDLEALSRTGDWISRALGRENESRVGKAVMAKVRREQE
ncbi:hypothetical protein KEM55_002181 [Ascosphaera atra]|nr:hypothetical protein KEM55_002181 [Ascosphaera atra]